MQSETTDPTTKRPASIWLWISPGCVAFVAYVDLAMRSSSPGGATGFDLARCVAVVTIAIGLVTFIYHRARQAPPRKGILAFSLLFHLIGVAGSPVLEDDGYRYLFDGWVFAERGSPYGIAPSEFFDSETLPPEIESSLSGINHPELPTIYGPTTQWVFRLAHAILPGQIAVLQAFMAGLSFALVCLLSRWAKPLALLFFAWHPLIIKEFAFTAHFDVLAVLLLAIALSMPRRFEIAIGAALGLAVGAKIFALLIVPAILRFRLVAWVAFGMTVLILYVPFLGSIFPLAGGFQGHPLWTMGVTWIFNAPLYGFLQPIIGSWALRALLAVFLIAYWVSWTFSSWRLPDTDWPRGDRLFGLMLLCAPVVNPWYLLWPLAFWIRKPTAWLAVASVAVMFSYATGLNLGDRSLAPYEIPNAVLIVEYGMIAVALGLDVWRRRA